MQFQTCNRVFIQNDLEQDNNTKTTLLFIGVQRLTNQYQKHYFKISKM